MFEASVFVDVILPLPLRQYYTYAVDDEWAEQLTVGKRVIVQFGAKKYYTAIVRRVHENQPKDYQPKFIESVEDDLPIVLEKHLEFWEWIAQYYMSAVGEVMQVAVPSGLKLSSETVLSLVEQPNTVIEHLPAMAKQLYEVLQARQYLSYKEIQKLLGTKRVAPHMMALLEAGVAWLSEDVQQKYKPKMEKYVASTDLVHHAEAFNTAFESLSRAQKQQSCLLLLFQLTQQNRPPKLSWLIEQGYSRSVINQLIDKDFVEIRLEQVSRLPQGDEGIEGIAKLSLHQQAALSKIEQTDKPSLLHGVTGSGKTEVYMHLIESVVKAGGQALFLLPEIALTAQMVQRLQLVFGDEVGVYHSKFNEQERVEIWQKVLNGEYKLVVGARSALFLPFINLQLIVVDEEHDNSYRQHDPAPRYHGRDAALMLAQMHQCKIILGSATPSLESYLNAKTGKFELVELTERFKAQALPEMVIVDIAEAHKRKLMRSHFSQTLLDAIEQTLKDKNQVILFQNRRGYSQFVTCGTCGWIPYCPNCDVSLTYHKYQQAMTCHYCNHRQHLMGHCKACGSQNMQIKGFGTEKIEDELKLFFPDATIDRMDVDAIRAKHGHEKVINRFESGSTDILVGTQMVSKGLDFKKVALVGVLMADQLMSFPEYRATENAFQLLTQVSGRAGRHIKGQVIIQAYDVEHPLLNDLAAHNYHRFIDREQGERQQYHYPPFVRMLKLTVYHKQNETVHGGAQEIVNRIKAKTPHQVLGPSTPLITRIRNQYIRNIMIKVPRGRYKDLVYLKGQIQVIIDQLTANAPYKSLRVVPEVDV